MTQTASIETLSDTARALVAPGKGILAADESTGTIKRRFDSIGAESTETNRRDYREMLFRTPGASEFISGVILYDETIRQKSDDGTPIVKVLSDAGIMPGIKVDIGAKELAGAPERASPRGWTACGSGLRSTRSWALGSPSGGRSLPSGRACPARTAWT